MDDDTLIQKVIVHTLEHAPVPLVMRTAADADAALRICAEGSVRIALLDVELPDLSGFELCARIRADQRLAGVPIFMLTGRGEVDAKAEAFRAGADDYLVKPVDTEELVLRVVRAVERTYGVKASVPAAAAARPSAAELAPRPEPQPTPPSAPSPLPAALRRPANGGELSPEAALLKGKTEPAPRPESGAALPRHDAWSKFLGRSRPQ